MQHFMIPCRFGTETVRFPMFVGEPVADANPLEQQAAWLARARGGSVPLEVLDAFEKLAVIARENEVSFEELSVYAMASALSDTGATEQSADPSAEG